MAAGFLEMISLDLDSVNQKKDSILKIKPGRLTKFAHFDFESIQQYLHPALVLFSGKMFGYNHDRLIYLAMAVQLIYEASGIHLRIPDDNYQTGENTDPRDGSQFPVLVGNYLYGRYFTGLCEGQILEFLSPLAQIIAEMNYGALLRKKNANLSVNDPELSITVIEKEISLLTEGSTKLAAILAGASPDDVSSLAAFGRNLGMIYGVMESGLDRSMAEPYFAEAVKSLQQLPAGDARNGLDQLLTKLYSGEMEIPVRKIGRGFGDDVEQAEEMVIPADYQDKQEYVLSIFKAIAKKYDTMNTVLSFNQDKYWRKFAVEQTGLKQGGKALDVCCGTGLITREIAKKVGPTGKVIGLDFCEEMLEVANRERLKSPYGDSIEYFKGNAMDLPFPDNMFDSVTIGFGLRNVPDMKKTIREMLRVVKPGGRVVSLEFTKPTVPVFKQVYNFYFDKWVPFLGKFRVGSVRSYKFLHDSWKAFPHQKHLREEFTRLGFDEATFYELTGGVVSVHVGVKPVEAPIPSVAATKE